MKTLRKIAIAALAIVFLCSATYLFLVYKNNIDAPPPPKQELQQALDKSIDWVLQNQDKLIKVNNPVLWWFLDESARMTNNYELSRLVSKYRHTTLGRSSVSSGYFTKTPKFKYYPGSLEHMQEYQKFFIYGLTCNTELEKQTSIQKQLDKNFCNWKPLFSSCSTHQLMGVRLLQTKNCPDKNLYNRLSAHLTEEINDQMIWDPRVGDLYMQRVLMLLESGNNDKVKPVWIQRIIDEQRSDGGWANFYSLFSIGKIEFGFGYVLPEIKSDPVSSFHTTAQAIYVLSFMNME